MEGLRALKRLARLNFQLGPLTLRLLNYPTALHLCHYIGFPRVTSSKSLGNDKRAARLCL